MMEEIEKTEEYWKNKYERLEELVREYVSDNILKEIQRKAAGHAGGVAHPKKDNPDVSDVHIDEISKPEVTEQYVRIPVNDCKITATIDIDKGKGIKALYCGKDKMIATYLFPSDDFTMEEAKAWVKEHKKSVEKGAISYNSAHPNGTPKADEHTDWDAAKEVAMADVDDLKVMCVYYEGDPDNKTSYKLPHHKAKGHAVVWKGVAGAGAAMMGARGGVDVPQSAVGGIKAHLGKHYREFDREPPWIEKIKVDKIFTITKSDEERHLVYGVVLEPETVDSQGDIVSAEEIEKAAHKFLKDCRVIYSEHKEKEPDIYVVESYITPQPIKFDEHEVKAGSWVMVVYCGDNEIWQQVKKGELTGYSIRGYANRI